MNWRLIGGVALGALVLRLIGFLPSIWIALGFGGLVWFWNFLVVQFPTQKKLVNWAMGGLVAVGLLTTIGTNLYNGHIAPYTVMSRAAIERAKLASDLEGALQVNPHMLKSRLEMGNQLQWIQDQVGERHAVVLNDIKQRLANNSISPQQAWDESLKILTEENLYREKSKDATSQLAVTSVKIKALPVGRGHLAQNLAIIGAVLLGMTLLPRIKIPGKGLWGTIGITLLVAALVLWRFPEMESITASIPSISSEISSPISHQGRVETKIVAIHPDYWSEALVPPPGVRFFLYGPAEAIALSLADGQTYPVASSFGKSSKWLQGFRFRGPEGETVTVEYQYR